MRQRGAGGVDGIAREGGRRCSRGETSWGCRVSICGLVEGKEIPYPFERVSIMREKRDG